MSTNNTQSIHMKYFFLALVAASILAACGSNGTGNAQLDALIAKRDSLKNVQADLAKELATIEEQNCTARYGHQGSCSCSDAGDASGL